jgi:hypothetical protein
MLGLGTGHSFYTRIIMAAQPPPQRWHYVVTNSDETLCESDDIPNGFSRFEDAKAHVMNVISTDALNNKHNERDKYKIRFWCNGVLRQGRKLIFNYGALVSNTITFGSVIKD